MQSSWFSSDDQTNFLNNVKRLQSLTCEPVASTSQRLMVFSHVPKTGGTTLESVLAKNFRMADMLHINAPDLNNNPDLLNLKKKPPTLICGHHPMHGLLYSLLPNQPLAHITMLRNPLHRVLSFYNYILGKSDHPLHPQCRSLSVEEFLRQTPTPELVNGQTRRLTGTLHLKQDRPADSADHAWQVLNDCFTDVMVTELYDQSLMMLRHRYGLQDIYYQRSNVSAKRVELDELSDATINMINEMNQEDIKLHQWALDHCRKSFSAQFDDTHLSDHKKRLRNWQALMNSGISQQR